MAKITIAFDTSELSASDLETVLNIIKNVGPINQADGPANARLLEAAPEDHKQEVINATKDAIIFVSNFPHGRDQLHDSAKLNLLLINDASFTQLAARLTEHVIQPNHAGKGQVSRSEVQNCETVKDCLDLVLEKVEMT